MQALLKRSEGKKAESGDIIRLDGLTIDLPAHTVTLGAASLDLTIKEYNILVKLASNINRIYSRDQLLDDIWGIDFDGDHRTVDSHVARLRTKLGRMGRRPLKDRLRRRIQD